MTQAERDRRLAGRARRSRVEAVMSTQSHPVVARQGPPPDRMYRRITATTPDELIQLLDLEYDRGWSLVSHCETPAGCAAILKDDCLEDDWIERA